MHRVHPIVQCHVSEDENSRFFYSDKPVESDGLQKLHQPLTLQAQLFSQIRQLLMNHKQVFVRENSQVTMASYSSKIVGKEMFLVMDRFELLPKPLKDEIVFDILKVKDFCQKNIQGGSDDPTYTIRYLQPVLSFVLLFDKGYFDIIIEGIKYLFYEGNKACGPSANMPSYSKVLSECEKMSSPFFANWKYHEFKKVSFSVYQNFMLVKRGIKTMKMVIEDEQCQAASTIYEDSENNFSDEETIFSDSIDEDVIAIELEDAVDSTA